jgi:hypothetical protein
MIRKLADYFAGVPPAFIDGALYVAIAFFGAWAAGLGNDEAAKYVQDETLFWARNSCGSITAALLALKMYRSTAYAEHVREKNGAPAT